MKLVDIDPIIDSLKDDVEMYNTDLDDLDLTLGHVRDILEHEKTTMLDIIEDLENAPRVNAVPVTYCKYCKHYSDNLNDISGVCHYEIMARIRGPEDYCSKGVRKDNKKDI